MYILEHNQNAQNDGTVLSSAIKQLSETLLFALKICTVNKK